MNFRPLAWVTDLFLQCDTMHCQTQSQPAHKVQIFTADENSCANEVDRYAKVCISVVSNVKNSRQASSHNAQLCSAWLATMTEETYDIP